MKLRKILLVALMIISVLAIAGCGEEEKYNNAKKELVKMTDSYNFKNIEANDSNVAKFEEAYKQAEAKLAEMEKYSSSDSKLTNDYLKVKESLEQGKKLWNMRLAEEREWEKAHANANKTMPSPRPFAKYAW